ncbi:MAG: carboxypeptidase-like regulatory domain-containing protein [Longimicrobiales bacterium]
MIGCHALFCLALATTGCDILTSGCDPILGPGVRVLVLDSITGRPIPAHTVTVVVVDGIYADTAEVEPNGDEFIAVFDRPGVYRVEVKAAGFHPWNRRDVRVEAPDDCGNRATELTALMQPLT